MWILVSDFDEVCLLHAVVVKFTSAHHGHECHGKILMSVAEMSQLVASVCQYKKDLFDSTRWIDTTNTQGTRNSVEMYIFTSWEDLIVMGCCVAGRVGHTIQDSSGNSELKHVLFSTSDKK